MPRRVLYHDAHFDAIRDDEDTPQRVWIGASSGSSPRESIERLANAMMLDLRSVADSSRVVLHIQHVNAGDLTPPDLPTMFMIIGKLMENKDLVDERILGTCVQTQALDDVARTARDLFLSVYNPRRPLAVVENTDDAMAFMRSLPQ